MEFIVIIIFILGYLAITLEHSLKVDKLVPALIMMAFCWTIITVSHLQLFDVEEYHLVNFSQKHLKNFLVHHLGKTAEILIFLIGAMTIVEIIDYFNGFSYLKKIIKTKSKTKMLWIISILAFFLSAIIDNLTATIVLITILRKLVHTNNERIWFASLIIISANAGGAWSPIGDVTTTMLWIAEKVTTKALILNLFIPSIICMVVPVFIASRLKVFRGNLVGEAEEKYDNNYNSKYGSIMLFLGLGMIVFVPVFKTLTHLPPYVGMMLSLAIVSIFGEIFSNRAFKLSDIKEGKRPHSPIHNALTKIEMTSILFFLGILMAVAALETIGQLYYFSEWLNVTVPNENIVVLILGVCSAIIDNVPLVAASISMFTDPIDSKLWHFIAYAAGTGGSMLIIGSAAGVVAMGMEKIKFFWYMLKVGWLAFLGYLLGAVVFLLFFN